MKTKIILPQITLDAGAIDLKVGKKSLKIFTTPGNSPMEFLFCTEYRILFTGDSFLPLPVIVEAIPTIGPDHRNP